MFDVKTEKETVEFVLSSKLVMVDRLLAVVMDFLEEIQEKGNSKYFQVVLRELLCNAIEHGNNNDYEKVVSGEIKRLSSGRYRISVVDEGGGVDENVLQFDGVPDDTRGRSMGFVIVNTYCDEIRFVKEDAKVIAFVTLPIETEFKIDNKNVDWEITPSGDISASIAEKFRDTLIEWFDSNDDQNCVINLENVDVVDSISLGVLVNFFRMRNQAKDERVVSINNISDALYGLFRLTQLHTMYKLVPRKQKNWTSKGGYNGN